MNHVIRQRAAWPPMNYNEQQATINGLDLDIKHSVWLIVYEGQRVVSSQKTASVEAQVERPG